LARTLSAYGSFCPASLSGDFYFNRTSSGQYSSLSVFVHSLSESLLSYLISAYTIAPFQQCDIIMLLVLCIYSLIFLAFLPDVIFGWHCFICDVGCIQITS